MKIQTKASKSNEVSKRERDNRNLARDVAAESIVLLKNDGTLPIDACPVALYGAGAATTIKGGTGSGEVNERFSVSIEQGLSAAGFDITTKSWLRDYEVEMNTKKAKANKEIVKKLFSIKSSDRINLMEDGFQYPPGRLISDEDIKASACETCIYVIARQAGECTDRKLAKHDYSLTDIEIENIKTAIKSYKKVIIVINAGGSMDISPLDELDGINSVIWKFGFCRSTNP